MGILSRIFGKDRPEFKDAERVYAACLKKSRTPEFYGEGKMPDTYEGRVDCLTLHMAPVMKRLNMIDENGKKLSQTIFDAMVDDFDIALRGEGLTDTGVSRRIKPIVAHFYARLKAYNESFGSDNPAAELENALRAGQLSDANKDFVSSLSTYIMSLENTLSEKNVGDIAQVNFEFPELQF